MKLSRNCQENEQRINGLNIDEIYGICYFGIKLVLKI
jgi:hypothetical protein